MAFLNKLKFLKKSGAEDDWDEGDDPMNWSIPDESEPDSGEGAGGLGRFNMNTVKVADADGAPSGEGPDDDSLIFGDGEESEDNSSEDEPKNSEGSQEESATSSLLGLFEEETEVDHQLESLASWVEEVEAEDLADEARALMEDLESL